MRVDIYTFVAEKAEFISSKNSVDEAVAFAQPLSRIPGNKIAFVIFDGDKPVDLMVW